MAIIDAHCICDWVGVDLMPLVVVCRVCPILCVRSFKFCGMASQRRLIF